MLGVLTEKIKLWKEKMVFLPFIYLVMNFAVSLSVLFIATSQTTAVFILGVILFIIEIICCSLIAVVTIRMVRKKSLKFEINRYVFSFLLALNSLIMPEIVLNSNAIKGTWLFWGLGFLLCILIYTLGSCLFRRPKIWYIFWTVFFSLYAIFQFYIYEFRGEPVRFADLFNLKSATAIQGEYHFFFAAMPMCCVINAALVILFIVKAKIPETALKNRLISSGCVVIGAVVMYFAGCYAFNSGIKNRYITLNFSGEENYCTFCNVGFDLMFYFDGMYNHIQVPDGYSDEKAEEILNEYEVEKAEDKPIIIAILNESFADFRHIADFDTNMDYMPNYHALQSESVSGYVTVSAYGGYSCNSEYEFLSGNSMSFLPSGSAAYTQFLNCKQDSLVSYLNSLGYITKAVTPCEEELWEIGKAYKNLQFDSSVFKCTDDLPESEVKKINGNISDSSLYKVVEKYADETPSDQSSFLWVTTMQNHGPYSRKSDIPKLVTFEDYNNSDAQKYLNSIYQSDKALAELVEHYRNYDREVVIVMFGDHYPHIPEFTEHLYDSNVAGLSTSDYSRLHQTPFLIWNNKKSSAEKIDDISLNFLSDEVMKVAGLPLAPYQQELEKVRKSVPIISSFGYKNSDGEWLENGENDYKTENIRNDYGIMQYYRIFAEK